MNNGQNILRPPILVLNNENIPVIPENQILGINNQLEMANLFPPGFHMSMLAEIPSYDGNSSALSEFIRSVEVISTQFLVPAQPDAYINKFLLSSVRNKLKGNALEVITGYEFNTWAELKTTLINNFGDQRSELNLTIDLAKTRQNSKENPIEFYNRIRTLLATFNSKIALGKEVPAVKEYKLSNVKDLALRTYLSGLNEPFGSLLRCRNPATLEKAISIVRDEIDIRYSQNSIKTDLNISNQRRNPTNANPRYNSNSQNLYAPRYNNFTQSPSTSFQNQPMPTQNFSFNNGFPRNQNPTMRLNPNNPPSQFPNQRPFGNKNQNVFAPQRGYKNYTPGEPMQTGTVNKRPPTTQSINPNNSKRPYYQNTQYIRQSNQPRNFHSEELFNHDLEYYEENPDDFPNDQEPEYSYENYDYETYDGNDDSEQATGDENYDGNFHN